MNRVRSEAHRRILIVDDSAAIHDDFRKTLCSKPPRTGLNEAEAELFESPNRSEPAPLFELDSAYQGKEALLLVQRALEEGRPYAVVFMDVRMPPGWDGIETTEQLWRVDPQLQIVICTAFSDYTWDNVVERLGESDRLVILKKPFEPVEVQQIALALTEKWRLDRQVRQWLTDIAHVVEERTRDLRDAKAAVEAANRSHHTWLAEIRQGLNAPADEITSAIKQLLKTKLDGDQRPFAVRILQRAEALKAMVEDLAAYLKPPPASGDLGDLGLPISGDQMIVESNDEPVEPNYFSRAVHPMKRSEINHAFRDASDCFHRHGWSLPPNPRWDITDFGLGDFPRYGLTLINLATDPEYCEKVMYARRDQRTPCHAHRRKKEDIVCRAGALTVWLWPRRPADESTVPGDAFPVWINGVETQVPAGVPYLLPAGHRMTIAPGIWHAFAPASDECVIGEVSTANDDAHDNIFLNAAVGRFPAIDEDEPKQVQLVGDL